jgi:hypothetical protein
MSSMSFPGQGKSEEPEWVVWLTVLISLLIGWVITTTVTGQTASAPIASGSLRYPASWVKTKEDGAIFAATDLNNGSYGARISVRQVGKADLIGARGQDNLDNAASGWTVLRSQDLEGYRVLKIDQVKLQGRDAVAIEYAYLTDAPEGQAAGAMPALMHAIDTVIASGDQYTILSVAVDQSGGDSLAELNSRIQAGSQLP